MAINMKGKDLISIADLSLEEIYQIFDVSKTLKQKLHTGESHRVLEGKTLGMIFTKRSTRTRVSFEVGIYQLGGIGMYFGPNDLQLGTSESVSDTAKVLSRFLNGIMIRTFSHSETWQGCNKSVKPIFPSLTA